MSETIDLTTEAFKASNPNAAANIAKANKAAADLENILRAKADLAREMATYIREAVSGAHLADKRADRTELLREWDNLNKAHADAGKRLHEAVRGV